MLCLPASAGAVITPLIALVEEPLRGISVVVVVALAIRAALAPL